VQQNHVPLHYNQCTAVTAVIVKIMPTLNYVPLGPPSKLQIENGLKKYIFHTDRNFKTFSMAA
jgi:hypothetical protein